MKDFDIYSNGIVCLSVCAINEMPKEDVVKRVNSERPTGLSNDWEISSDPFASGSSNPCACSDRPKTHTHYLMVC